MWDKLVGQLSDMFERRPQGIKYYDLLLDISMLTDNLFRRIMAHYQTAAGFI